MIPMPPNQQVRVIRHDGARPASVVAGSNHGSEGLRNRIPLITVKPDHREIQPRLCFTIERAKFIATGSYFSSPKMNLTQALKLA